jgi:hypothetical protein
MTSKTLNKAREEKMERWMKMMDKNCGQFLTTGVCP